MPGDEDGDGDTVDDGPLAWLACIGAVAGFGGNAFKTSLDGQRMHADMKAWYKAELEHEELVQIGADEWVISDAKRFALLMKQQFERSQQDVSFNWKITVNALGVAAATCSAAIFLGA